MTEIVLEREIEEELLDKMNVLEHIESEGQHRYVIESGHHDLLEKLVKNNHTISTWRVVPQRSSNCFAQQQGWIGKPSEWMLNKAA